MAGRPSRLADPEFCKNLAELYVRGVGYEEIAEELNCGKDSIRVWVRDPRVTAHARRLAAERVQRICRKIDSEIETRLNNIEKWDMDVVLKVRKEYLDRPLKLTDNDSTDSGKVANELSEAMDQNPDFAEQLTKLLSAGK